MGESNLATWLTDPALLAFLGGVYVLFAADFLTGVLAAARNGALDVQQLPNILVKQGTQVGMITALAILAGSLQTPLGIMAVTASGAYALAAQKSIRNNLGELATTPDDEGDAPDNA